MPRSHSGSRSSSSYVIGSGNSRESLRSFQNRFEYPAKWWPVIADRTPGLMPTNSTRKPGRMRSFKRSSDQSDFIILSLAVTSTFNARRSAFGYVALLLGVRPPPAQYFIAESRKDARLAPQSVDKSCQRSHCRDQRLAMYDPLVSRYLTLSCPSSLDKRCQGHHGA